MGAGPWHHGCRTARAISTSRTKIQSCCTCTLLRVSSLWEQGRSRRIYWPVTSQIGNKTDEPSPEDFQSKKFKKEPAACRLNPADSQRTIILLLYRVIKKRHSDASCDSAQTLDSKRTTSTYSVDTSFRAAVSARAVPRGKCSPLRFTV